MARVAVVAGVGPGLGAELVRRFVAGGLKVAMLARSSDTLAALEGELGDAVLAVQLDLRDPQAIVRGFSQVREALGPIDVLVNHASSSSWQGLLELPVEDFESSWRTAVLAGFVCSQEAARDMVAAGAGTILFTGATSAIRGRAGAVGFSSAKFALRGLAQALARELGPMGVHVAHVVIDGLIDGQRSGDEARLQPAAIADSYWHLIEQPPSCWTLELDLRPSVEKF